VEIATGFVTNQSTTVKIVMRMAVIHSGYRQFKAFISSVVTNSYP